MPRVSDRKSHRRLRIIILLAVCLLLAFPAWIGINFGYWLLWGEHRNVEAAQRQILYKINYNAVLTAARQVYAQKATYRPDPGLMSPSSSQDYPDPDDPNMPAVIRALPRHRIIIDPRLVRIEMGGGFYHYGLIAYLPGAVPGPYEMRTFQLLPGLWYYAQDGKLPPP